MLYRVNIRLELMNMLFFEQKSKHEIKPFSQITALYEQAILINCNGTPCAHDIWTTKACGRYLMCGWLIMSLWQRCIADYSHWTCSYCIYKTSRNLVDFLSGGSPKIKAKQIFFFRYCHETQIWTLKWELPCWNLTLQCCWIIIKFNMNRGIFMTVHLIVVGVLY